MVLLIFFSDIFNVCIDGVNGSSSNVVLDKPRTELALNASRNKFVENRSDEPVGTRIASLRRAVLVVV